MNLKRNILCFGDSLTWGWVPSQNSVPTSRYAFSERWTGAMAMSLGDEYNVIEEGLNARTTHLDDPTDPRLNGSAYFPTSLASHLPLDLVIIMLGTNNTKASFRQTPQEIAEGMSILVGQAYASAGGVGSIYPAPKILIVSPPPLSPMPDPWFATIFDGSYEKSLELPKYYQMMANFWKVDFFEAGSVIETDGCDGIHLSAKSNQVLGSALADKVKSLFV
ncbi:SGNH/GDSL hydrolase family protein [Vibrio sp.]|uniref:Hydrolase n=1 Tax=Vibrio viridaestus TaxID=2487322 RepID=A0A3N9TJ99_9VIBR|nr:SGNH/GDSL hydrolase family protein [Vibrio viridaestus]MDC0610738.1 SGNH/GDSL hydrolase family protein [Vibrio sp.]RQW63635.1 hydrolase [Vibrio viridaestus]